MGIITRSIYLLVILGLTYHAIYSAQSQAGTRAARASGRICPMPGLCRPGERVLPRAGAAIWARAERPVCGQIWLSFLAAILGTGA